jgi:predicted ATP-dependent protease
MVVKLENKDLSVLLKDKDFQYSKAKKQSSIFYFQEKALKSIHFALENPRFFQHLIISGLDDLDDMNEIVRLLKDKYADNYLPNRFYYSPSSNTIQKESEKTKESIPLFNLESKQKPILFDFNPNISSLFGIPTESSYHPGTLVKSNGGFLILPIQKLEKEPVLTEILLASLIQNEIDFMKMPEVYYFHNLNRLVPNIPISTRIVLIGDEFCLDRFVKKFSLVGKIFKMKVDLDYEVDLNPKNISTFSQALDSLVEKGNPGFHISAKKRLLEETLIQNENKEKFSFVFNELKSIYEEMLLRQKNRNTDFTEKDIDFALDSIDERYSYPKKRYYDELLAGTYNIKLTGTRLGRINALSVLTPYGIFQEYGQVNVVSARAILGGGNFLNIEREVNLSGDLHDKGIFVLQSYLKGCLSHLNSFGYDVSILFEQNHTVIDGDSATVAELLVTLSALSGVEIPCNIAVTGSMTQYGESLPVGSVIQKIVAFYEISELLGDKKLIYKVYIPKSNLKNTILPSNLKNAVLKGKLEIYTYGNAEEIIQDVFKMPLGEYIPQKGFQENSILKNIEKRLENKKEIQ